MLVNSVSQGVPKSLENKNNLKINFLKSLKIREYIEFLNIRGEKREPKLKKNEI